MTLTSVKLHVVISHSAISYLHTAGRCRPGRRPPSPRCSLLPGRHCPPSSSSWSWSPARRRCCTPPSPPSWTTGRSHLGRASRSPSPPWVWAACDTSRKASHLSSRSCPGRSGGSESSQTPGSSSHGLNRSVLPWCPSLSQVTFVFNCC